MLNKGYIGRYISEEFPDLKNTEFNLNNADLSAFSEKTLLPFLIYQNTVDSKCRIIELYLQENSSSIHFLPFYVAVGFYRKAVDKALTAQKFKNEKFPPNLKPVRYNAGICHITGINFISRTIQLRGGTGDLEVSFEEDYKLKWDNYKSSADIKQRLEAFSRVDNASRNNIFTLPQAESGKEDEGVILFSSVSKFETLLRNLRVSGNDLRQHLHIQAAVITEDAIRFKLLSAARTKTKPVTVLAVRNDAVMAFDTIIAEGKGAVGHLNTIIIDDFDELLGRWERSGILAEKLNELKSIYFDRLGTTLKDIYLICRNRNFNIHQLLQKHAIPALPWQITPREKAALDGLNTAGLSLKVERITDKSLESCQQSIESLLYRWKELGKSQFCDGQTISQVSTLYTIRDKLLSFFNPEKLSVLIGKAERDLKEFRRMWFTNNQDDNLIQLTLDFLSSAKLIAAGSKGIPADLCDIVKQTEERASVVLVTNNNDPDDYLYLESGMKKEFPDAGFTFLTIREFLQSGQAGPDLPCLIVYFSWNRDLLNNALTNLAAVRQIFLTNRKSRGLILNHFHRSAPLIEQMSSTSLKYELLNLQPPPEESPELIDISAQFPDIAGDESEDGYDTVPEDISGYVNQVLDFFNSKTQDTPKKGIKNCVVWFDDGTHLEWPENKSVFYFDEQAEEASESVQKEACQLVRGDLVLIPKNRAEMKNILRNALTQDEKLGAALRYDDEWRKKISDHIENGGLEIEDFRDDLVINGFNISTGTIKNWIEGETIKPHNYRRLLGTLISLEIITEEKANLYYQSNKTLKSHTTQFVRSAVRKLIFSLRGINYGDDGIFDQKLINGFLDHVDIKPVLGIYAR